MSRSLFGFEKVDVFANIVGGVRDLIGRVFSAEPRCCTCGSSVVPESQPDG